jgi:hypothetical protein
MMYQGREVQVGDSVRYRANSSYTVEATVTTIDHLSGRVGIHWGLDEEGEPIYFEYTLNQLIGLIISPNIPLEQQILDLLG